MLPGNWLSGWRCLLAPLINGDWSPDPHGGMIELMSCPLTSIYGLICTCPLINLHTKYKCINVKTFKDAPHDPGLRTTVDYRRDSVISEFINIIPSCYTCAHPLLYVENSFPPFLKLRWIHHWAFAGRVFLHIANKTEMENNFPN